MLLFATGDLGAAAQFQNAEAMSSMSGDTCLRREKVQPHGSRPSAAGVLTREMTQKNDIIAMSKIWFSVFFGGVGGFGITERLMLFIHIVYMKLEKHKRSKLSH